VCGGGLVKLTQVKLIFFFFFYNKLLSLELCYFLTFFLFDYSKNRLVKLTWVGSRFFFYVFFIELWFFARSSF
jgi:hypothetical protein